MYVNGSYITPQSGTEYSIQYKRLADPSFELIDPADLLSRLVPMATILSTYLQIWFIWCPGNYTIYSGYNGENQIAIGGDGNDTYKISTPGFLTIADLSNFTYDVVEATGIGVYRPNTLLCNS